MKRLVPLCLLALICSGCYVTKVVSVPMRVVGAVASVTPIAGNAVHNAIDDAADEVDELP